MGASNGADFVFHFLFGLVAGKGGSLEMAFAWQ
jgi:hypothetical protein